MELSIVIPIYNEEQVINELKRRLLGLIENLEKQQELNRNEIEVIFVNDGSTDNSLSLLLELSKEDKVFKVLNLSRNFGHQIAITAGIDYAIGNAIVLIDGDLQDPPEFIMDLYKKYKEGFDVVYAVRKVREGESAFKRITAKFFYRFMRLMTNIEIPVDTGDFRILSRRVVNVLNSMKERHRFIRGMITWVGFKQTGLFYERKERFAGETKYPLKKMIKFAWDAITSFSSIPLKLVSYLGFMMALIGFALSLYVIYIKIFTTKAISGWSSLMITILIMSGLQLIALGLIGEYIGRISEEAKNRPLYIVENFYKQ